jgi:hypothetical protein
LRSIPKELGQLTKLEDLYHLHLHRDLRDNQLTSIPKELGELKNLEKLMFQSRSL